MTLRWAGAAVAIGGCTAILWWGATAGSNPTAVAGSFDLPAIGFLVVILGFFVWLAGMVRGERRERGSWRELDRRDPPPGYFDTFVFDALGGGRPGAPSAGGAASAASGRPSPKRRSSLMPVPRQDPRPAHPTPSPVALAVLDSIELRRETGEDPLPAAVKRSAAPTQEPAMPRPATAAARARA